MRRAAITGAVLGVLLLIASGAARAETVQQAYARAVQEHFAGNYDKAIESMQRILAVPMENADLHYNLGCAHFRAGKLGPAIYHFERSLALNPGGDDASYNLAASRALAASKVTDQLKGAARESFWVRAANVLSARTWTITFLVLWWLSLGLLLILRYVGPGALRAGLVAGTSFVALVTLICGLLFLGRVHQDSSVRRGIVLPDRLEVREGPSASAKSTFKLHAGFKVRLQAKAEGWVRIRLPNGLEGWASARDIGLL